MAGRRRAVGDVEAAVEAGEGIGVDNNDFKDVVEAVVASLAVIPGRVGERTHVEIDAGAEGGTQRQEGAGKEQQADLCAQLALAKRFDGAVVRRTRRCEDCQQSDGNGQESKQNHPGRGRELNATQLVVLVSIECEEGVDRRRNNHE